MTRGKQVQDFIKENKKSARERFEEAGWKFEHDNQISIEYSLANKYGCTYVRFCKDGREYYLLWNGDYAYVDMELHKLINYQLEELGWLN